MNATQQMGVFQQPADFLEISMIHDQDKTKEQLIAELAELRRKVNPVLRTESARGRGETPQTKEMLKEIEARFRIIADYTYDWESWVGLDGNLVWINPAVEKITGYSCEEYLNMPDRLKKIILDDDRERIVSHFENGLKLRLSDNDVEFRIRCKDGSLKWVSLSYQPIYSHDGEYYGLRSSIRDINERKAAAAELENHRQHLEDLVAARTAELTALNLQLQHEIEEHRKTEDALRQSEEQIRSVIETASDAIVSADSSGNVILWNKAAENIFGFTAEEMLNKSFLKIMPVQSRENHWRQFTAFIANRKPGIVVSHGELLARRKDGSLFPTEGSAAVWETKDGFFITSIIRDSTERKQAAVALQESEKRFRSLAQTATEAIIIINSKGDIIFWNKSAERIYGYTEKEVLHKNNSMLVPSSLQQQSELYFEQLLRGSTIAAPDNVYESYARNKNGSEFPVEIAMAMWGTGDTTFYCVMLRDITERKRAEAALRESEVKFRTMTENITAAIFIYQGNNPVYVNPAAVKTCGYTREELLSMHFWDIVHPDFIEQVRGWGLKRQAGEDLPSRYELKIKTKQGAERWFDYAAAAIQYNGGTAVLGTAIDITERKLAEEALRQSEERYRLTAENIPIHLGVINQDRKFVLWNKYSVKMFGYTQDEMINRESPDLIISGKGLSEELIRAAGDDGIYDGDLTLQRKDGSQFPGHLIVVPSKNADGLITGYYGFAEDITQRKRAEELIIKVNDCLLSFSAEPDDNIQRIIEVAGTIFNGASAAYFKKQHDLLQIAAAWNLSVDYIHPPQINAHQFDKLFASSGDSPMMVTTTDVLPFLNKNSSMLQMGFESFIATPINVGDTFIGSLNVAFKEEKTFSSNELNVFSILAKAISIEEERKKVLEDLKQHQLKLINSEKSLKAFSGRILSIREEEQKKISSALHDEIGSMVVALSSGLAIAKEDIAENSLEPAFKSLELTEAALKQAVDNLKKIAIDLRPPNMDIVGLSNALKSFFLNVTRQTKISIDFSAKIDDNKINEATAIVLYRTAQEALNNIVKHAKAEAVSIRLYEMKNNLLFEIADNGRGFNTESVDASSRAITKIGILGMRERIAALRGTLKIESAPQKGTTLHITIPKRRGKNSWK